MRSLWKCLPGIFLSIGAAQASGGLVVTSYNTLASANGYAPVSREEYFAEQQLDNVSPAIAEVSGDWTGPNANGTPNTWHFVGNARATSTTTITPDSYTAEASASFAYTVDTTAAFSDPSSTSIFGPGATAQYNGYFETDVPLIYTLTCQLNQRGRAYLLSFQGTLHFNFSNPNTTPQMVNLTGTIPAGRYRFFAGSGLGAANLPSGVNQYVRSGSVEALTFSVRVPEPVVGGVALAILGWNAATSRRCRRGLD